MFSHVAIHYPKPQYVAALLESMHRVDVAAQSQPGLVRIGPWKEVAGSRILGISVWESEAHFQAAGPAIFAVVADDPFDEWNDKDAENFFLEDV